MRTIGTPAELERRRLLAVQRVVEGYSAEEVSDFLGVNPSSVSRWVAAFHQYGAKGLAARSVPGRPALLTTPQEKIVRRWLRDNPIDHGFATQLWTASRVGLLIEQEFGVHFNPNYLSTWLRQRNYTPQLPRRVPRERDDRKIARWLAEDWPRIKRMARERGACLMLLDESGLLMAPLRRRSWSLRGQPLQMKEKAGHREKVSVIGDSGSMHKGGPIRELVADSKGRLVLEPLPAHAPMLNPIEQVWTWLKYGRLCNFAPQDAHDLNQAVIRELDPIRDEQQRLQNFFHASDLPLPRALLT